MKPMFSPSPEQKENVRHGDAVFPIQRYVTRLTRRQPEVCDHWHEEAELTLIREGSCACQIQLQPTALQAGDLVFLTPALLHSFSVEETDMTSESFVFHMNFLGTGDVCALRYTGPMTAGELLPPPILRREHPAYEAGLSLFQQLGQLWEQKAPGYELLIKARLLSFLALMLPYCRRNSDPGARNEVEKIKAVLEFMSAHYGEEIAVADMASVCYFSQYHFMRFFKKHMGISCGAYLKNLRLEKAAECFRRGETAILDVAMANGFRNLSYFYREFQKKYAMTPRQYLLWAEESRQKG